MTADYAEMLRQRLADSPCDADELVLEVGRWLKDIARREEKLSADESTWGDPWRSIDRHDRAEICHILAANLKVYDEEDD